VIKDQKGGEIKDQKYMAGASPWGGSQAEQSGGGMEKVGSLNIGVKMKKCEQPPFKGIRVWARRL